MPIAARIMLLSTLFACLLLAGAGRADSAYAFLHKAQAPSFKPGHTLPPLTRWAWPLDVDLQKELAERWGYALQIELSPTGRELERANAREAQLVALAAREPDRYPLAVACNRPWLEDPAFKAAINDDAYTRDAHGSKLSSFSPVMPDAYYQRAAETMAAGLARVQAKAPIRVVLNGGEHGLGVPGNATRGAKNLANWSADPAVTAARGQTPWPQWYSARRAHYEGIVSKAAREAAPKALYLYYPMTADPMRGLSDFHWQWTLGDWKDLRTLVSYPSASLYYNTDQLWATKYDLLTQALDATAYQIASGDRHSYPFVSGGWVPATISDDARYIGFLKSLYTAGALGAVAGYFDPKIRYNADQGRDCPAWVRQLMDLGQVHAAFTWLEDDLRNGDLLPGTERHRWSKDLPAYECVTGDPAVRVLARKHRAKDQWLISAWAADGPNRNVTVTIPDLGKVTLPARTAGSLYRALPGPKLILLDDDALCPSAGLAAKLAALDRSQAGGGRLLPAKSAHRKSPKVRPPTAITGVNGVQS